jgi:NAD(P)-dependent dehydrogenase (short-subunit alcohol dehydrogenase family)
MSAYAWSTSDIPSLAGTTAVVTGANSGIGWHTAAELARHGADVTLAVRSLDKGEAAAAQMREGSAGTVRVARLDLGSLASVQEFAEAWDGPLGLLVNNAGLMSPPRYRETADGHELQFGTNHLGHFALTGRLLPALLAAPASRVVTVSSIAHHQGRADVVEGNPAGRYSPAPTYGNSKLANLLFAFELQRRADRAGLPLRSVAAHPGLASTNLQTAGPRMQGQALKARISGLVTRVIAQDAAHGALPTLYAATMPDLPGGTYIGPDGSFEARGHPRIVTAKATAYDEADARRLWTVSEALTGVSYLSDAR